MNSDKKILRKVNREGSPESPDVVFFCPGCLCGHGVWVNPNRNPISNGTWSWNGNIESPTFSPSLLIEDVKNKIVCHSFVKNGMIQFLSDCTHDLKGQTVPLPEF